MHGNYDVNSVSDIDMVISMYVGSVWPVRTCMWAVVEHCWAGPAVPTSTSCYRHATANTSSPDDVVEELPCSTV